MNHQENQTPEYILNFYREKILNKYPVKSEVYKFRKELKVNGIDVDVTQKCDEFEKETMKCNIVFLDCGMFIQVPHIVVSMQELFPCKLHHECTRSGIKYILHNPESFREKYASNDSIAHFQWPCGCDQPIELTFKLTNATHPIHMIYSTKYLQYFDNNFMKEHCDTEKRMAKYLNWYKEKTDDDIFKELIESIQIYTYYIRLVENGELTLFIKFGKYMDYCHDLTAKMGLLYHTCYDGKFCLHNSERVYNFAIKKMFDRDPHVKIKWPCGCCYYYHWETLQKSYKWIKITECLYNASYQLCRINFSDETIKKLRETFKSSLKEYSKTIKRSVAHNFLGETITFNYQEA